MGSAIYLTQWSAKAQKMQMLKTHVTGEAETQIKDLIISETNFDSAWQRLMHRYNNKLFTQLLNQSPCKGDSKHGLQNVNKKKRNEMTEAEKEIEQKRPNEYEKKKWDEMTTAGGIPHPGRGLWLNH